MNDLRDGQGDGAVLGPRERAACVLALLLGVYAYVFFLGYHNSVDHDMWAKLAIGASVWHRGEIPSKDIFAFTPVLDHYIDHEWGAGVWYYVLLQLIGPFGLMLHKLATALGVVCLAMGAGRLMGARPEACLALAIPGAIAVLPGFIPVIRSHSFTYLFFAATLLLMELIRHGRRWPVAALPLLFALWVNVHGGFPAGLGMAGFYAIASLWERRHWKKTCGAVTLASLATLANPWGVFYWPTLFHAVTLDRANIPEWQPLPLLRMDSFYGFRVMFVLAAILLAVGWRGVDRERRSPAALAMLLLTAYLGWRVQRHVTFFGIVSTAVLAPYLEATVRVLAGRIAALRKLTASYAVLALHAAAALVIGLFWTPHVSFFPLAQVGAYPVREADILHFSGAKGNVAVPFNWGAYVMWRLHPNNLVSIDGRYEAVYKPESFEWTLDLYYLRGENWDRLLREYDVPFVMLDFMRTPLAPEHLEPLGYKLVFMIEDTSGLMVKEERIAELLPTLRELPGTIQPLDPEIPLRWLLPDDAQE